MAFFVTDPIEGQPERFENDLQRRVYAQLGELAIDFCRVENEPAVTMDDCKNIDRAFGVETIKTVFLTNRQKTRFYLVAMPADKPFVTRDFCGALQIPRVSFADSDTLMAMLGTPHGAATPLSSIADTEGAVTVVVDKEVAQRDKIVCTDGTLHGFVCLSATDLVDKYLRSPVIATF